ncbi:MAG TPA: fatty acid desaturase [Arenimonas sp.]|nr:fatty acid desaturase [Arenimonas sp.]
MFNLSIKPRAVKAHINGREIAIDAGETLLQGALRHGIDFPNSCRVGGCATCKCRLAEGRVKEMTESGYILSKDEIDQGYILACQSVPQSDLRIEVSLPEHAARRRVSGRVTAQTKLTHDITRLDVQLDEALDYAAGQFADISIDALPGVSRSYSFATPAQPDGQVSFFVRKVPGGVFSTAVNEQDFVGQPMQVDGPSGNFWLRPGDAPMVLLAGGSGLAPVLALLQDALAKGVTRSATLLFGARTENDLYALDEIESIARRWQGDFRFIPILSDCAGGDAWTGRRGLVADLIPEIIVPGAHAYLCGPPAMIDSAVDSLTRHGIYSQHIHADRFSTQQDTAVAARSPDKVQNDNAGIFDYLKYFTFLAIGLLSAFALLAGGPYITAGLLGVLGVFIFGDALLGDDTRSPHYRYPWILTAQVWLALPLLLLIVFAGVWSVSTGDPLGVGAWLGGLSGYDLLAARELTTLGQHVAGIFLTGLMIGAIGTVSAHELTHRTWDPVSMAIGRLLLAFSFDTVFSIEHVYGHHRYVSTEHDPATAPRGRNVYSHILSSTLKGNVSAWNIERERLQRRSLGLFSWHNAVIRGHSLSAALVALAWLYGGAWVAAYFVLCALWGKATLEIVNYMEHYGIVRDPAEPVQPRHSWNTNKRVSSWGMFNLTRHSHHHAQGEVPYQDLKPYPHAPMMINGYLTTFVVTLIPPLWHYLMTPKVLAWDRDFANADERRLAAIANERSGRAVFRMQTLKT